LLARVDFICVKSDGWSNIKIHPVINYMLVTANASLFLESNYTAEQAHTADFLASDLSLVMKKLGPAKVPGAVMDNSAADKAARALMKTEFSFMLFQGCVSHGQHLVVRYSFVATTAKPGRLVASYPEVYAFEHLLEFANKCKNIVKFFHNHHIPKAQLVMAWDTSKLRMLVPMAPTRWSSVTAIFMSILNAETALL
jgi:hypothetical protein